MSVTTDIQIVCEGSVPTEQQLQSWAESALASLDEDCELSIRLVEELESAELNETYRAKTGPTNVLSFPFQAPVELSPRLLGDLVICRPVIEREAQEQNKQIEHHWAHMVVHGCLHLLGYDHIADDEAEIMEFLERDILKSMSIEDPYREQDEQK